MANQDTSPVKASYIFLGATVRDIPTTGLFHTRNKYVIKLGVYGEEDWVTSERMSRDGAVVWEGKEEEHRFSTLAQSMLHVSLCTQHAKGAEVVGSGFIPVSSWREEAAIPVPLVHPSGNRKLTSHVILSIKPTSLVSTPSASTSADGPVPSSPAHHDVPTIAVSYWPVSPAPTAHSNSVSTGPAGERVEDDVRRKQSEFEDTMKSLKRALRALDKLRMGLVDVPQARPFMDMTRNILLGASEIVREKEACDVRLNALSDRIAKVYEILCTTRGLQSDKVRADLVLQISQQTVECATFMSSYIGKMNWVDSITKFDFSTTTSRLDEYNQRLDLLLQAFQIGSQVSTEITTMLVLNDVRSLATSIRLQDFPYVGGARYHYSKRCLEGTRTDLLDEISDWVRKDDEEAKRILVLVGGAGTGKSTIAHTIAHRFSSLKRLGSSFCFSTSHAATRKPVNLFRNIAIDLANLIPAFKTALLNHVGNDISQCTTDDVMEQFENFILAPARELTINGTILIVVDALDESGTVQEREELLLVLFRHVSSLPSAFRILLTCRDEHDIRTLLHNNMQHLQLRQMPTLATDSALAADMLKYVEHRLSYKTNELVAGLTDHHVHQLSEKAEGVFQWAFVACDFIYGQPIPGETPYSLCEKLLSGPSGGTGLDILYLTVLEQIMNRNIDALPAFRAMLGIALAVVEPLSLDSLQSMMSLAQDGVSLNAATMLPLLGSLLTGTDERTAPVRPLHSSFARFLWDTKRSGDYCIDQPKVHTMINRACLRILKSDLHFNMGEFNTSYKSNREMIEMGRLQGKVSERLAYASKHWAYHLPLGEKIDAATLELIDDLFTRNFFPWLDAASVGGIVNEVAHCISLVTIAMKTINQDLCNIANDALQFIHTFAPVIAESAPHIYLSTLIWTPTSSALGKRFLALFPGQPEIVTQRGECWPTSLIKHAESVVNSVAFSPDGRRVVAGCNDHLLRIWDAHSGILIGDLLRGHHGPVNSVQFSFDGKQIVSGSFDSTIRLWEAETGKPLGDALTGHEGRVWAVAFSHDSTRVVSGSKDRTVRVWDAIRGTDVSIVLRGHTDTVTSVAVSPDGKMIASASKDHTIRLWDADNGVMIGQALEGHLDWVHCVRFSPDGQQIASSSKDCTIRLWDRNTRKEVGSPWCGHGEDVCTIAFSPDGKHLVSGSRDKTIRMWSVEKGSVIGDHLRGHDGPVWSVDFSADGRRIVAGSVDQTVRIWEFKIPEDAEASTADTYTKANDTIATPRKPSAPRPAFQHIARCWTVEDGRASSSLIHGHKGAVSAVAVSSDGKRAASGSKDGTLRIWDTDTWSPVCDLLRGHEGSVLSIVFSFDGTKVVSSSEDKTIRVWDAETGKAVGRTLHGHEDRIWCIAFSPDGKRLVSGSKDRTVRLWDAETYDVIGSPMVGHEDTVTCVAFAPDGLTVVSGSKDRTIRMFDAETGSPKGIPLRGHEDVVWCLSLSANETNGSLLLSGSADKTVRIWDIHNQTPIGDALRGHTSIVTSVSLSEDNRHVISCSLDHTARYWDVETRKGVVIPLDPRKSIVPLPWCAALSAGGKQIVSITSDLGRAVPTEDRQSNSTRSSMISKRKIQAITLSLGGSRPLPGSWRHTMQMLDVQTKHHRVEPLTAHKEVISSAALSPDGRLLAIGAPDNTLRLWDTQLMAPVLSPLRGHETSVLSIAFSPDGKHIASGSEDGTVCLWDTGKDIGEYITLRGHEDRIWCVSFSPDGTQVVSGSKDRTLRLWDVRTGNAIGSPLVGNTDTVTAVAFSPDGKQIVSGSKDAVLRIWDSVTHTTMGAALRGHNGIIRSITFSADGHRILSGSSDGTIRVWDAMTHASTGQPLNGHTSAVRAAAFSRDGNQVVSASEDQSIRMWNGNIYSAFGLHRPTSGRVIAYADSQRVMSITSDCPRERVTNWSVAFPLGGPAVLCMLQDSTVHIWYPRIGGQIWIFDVALSRDHKRLVTAALDTTTLRLWNTETWEPIGDPWRGHTGSVKSVDISPDGQRVVSGSFDNTVRLWTIDKGFPIGDPIRGHEDRVWCVVFSPDGKRIASGSKDRTIRIWDSETRSAIGEPLKGHTDTVAALRFTPDGNTIVSASKDHTLRRWNVETGEMIGSPMTGHENWILCIDMSPNGSRIVSGSDDRTVRLWDVRTGEAIGSPLCGHEDGVRSVAFSDDGKQVISASSSGSVRIWAVDSGTEADDSSHSENGDTTLVGSTAGDSRGFSVESNDGMSTIVVDTDDVRQVPALGRSKTEQVVVHSVAETGRNVPSPSPVLVERSTAASQVGPSTGDVDLDFVQVLPGSEAPSEGRPNEPPTETGETETTPAILPHRRPQNAILPNLTLSPYPEQQVEQPYSPPNAEEARFTFDFETGWIMGNDVDRILWVPPDQMRRLYTGQTLHVIPGPTIRVNLSKFVHGERWQECRGVVAEDQAREI